MAAVSFPYDRSNDPNIEQLTVPAHNFLGFMFIHLQRLVAAVMIAAYRGGGAP